MKKIDAYYKNKKLFGGVIEAPEPLDFRFDESNLTSFDAIMRYHALQHTDQFVQDKPLRIKQSEWFEQLCFRILRPTDHLPETIQICDNTFEADLQVLSLFCLGSLKDLGIDDTNGQHYDDNCTDNPPSHGRSPCVVYGPDYLPSSIERLPVLSPKHRYVSTGAAVQGISFSHENYPYSSMTARLASRYAADHDQDTTRKRQGRGKRNRVEIYGYVQRWGFLLASREWRQQVFCMCSASDVRKQEEKNLSLPMMFVLVPLHKPYEKSMLSPLVKKLPVGPLRQEYLMEIGAVVSREDALEILHALSTLSGQSYTLENVDVPLFVPSSNRLEFRY